MPPLALFDLDNTLVDRDAVFRRWAGSFAEAQGIGEDGLRWLLAADRDGQAPRAELFAALRERLALDSSVEDLVAGYERSYPGFIQRDDRVCRALQTLRGRGWRIAVVTNGGALQRVKVDRSGLTECVDACVVSGELGAWKPEPGIFEHAISVCGGRADAREDAWMVGDSVEHDIAGARAVGLRTVWIRRGRDWPLTGFRPDRCAESVPEAVDLLLAAGHPRT